MQVRHFLFDVEGLDIILSKESVQVEIYARRYLAVKNLLSVIKNVHSMLGCVSLLQNCV